jgi:hypothetical protein
MVPAPESPLAALSPLQRLEALSAAASESYTTPPQQQMGNSEMVARTHPSPQSQASPTGSLRRAGGVSGAPNGLQTPMRNGPSPKDHEATPMELQRSLSSSHDSARQKSEDDLEMPFLLRHYSEGPGFG